VDQHARKELNREYLIIEVTQHGTQPQALREEGFKLSQSYSCSFRCIPSDIPYRPPRITPRPLAQGAQTAVVVGPSGEEIHTDEYGRIKVHFHWDREGKKDDTASCWIRVAQSWAGSGWGGLFLPRIDQEVIVEFLDGDPDQPLVTGCVYNADNMPPYGLPGDKTKSTLKSRSSKGGDGFNELRFEDKKGDEEIFIHAEKNHTIAVENDESHSVRHDRVKTIDHDETVHVKNNRTETVGSNETIMVHGARTETVDGAETISIRGSRRKTVSKSETSAVALQRTHSVGVNETISVGGAQEITVGGLQALTVGALQAISVGASQTTKVAGSQSSSIGSNQSIQVGNSVSTSVGADESRKIGGGRATDVGKDDATKVAKNWLVDAGDSVTIKTGSASITMKKDGTIHIKGKDVTVEGSGKVNVKASGDIVMKGSKILQN
jgi:type VI secretion system secreted protein VgrG